MILVTSHPQDKSRILTILAFSCWYIWKTKCNLVFNGSPIVPSQVLHTITFTLGSFLEAQVPQSSLPYVSSTPDPHWSPPTAPYIKFNVDASWFQLDGRATLAAVLQDHDVFSWQLISFLLWLGWWCLRRRWQCLEVVSWRQNWVLGGLW